ncbi:MAG: ACT domain-containing protein [Planctomycetota bacterium]
MQIEKQFAISGVNKPGVLANICRALADEKVNIKALTITDSAGQDVMRMVVDRADLARTVLAKINSPVKESKVITVEIPNRPGAFAALAEKLGRAHITIESAYCTSGAPSGRATAIFEVPYIEKTMKVMQEALDRRQERILPNVRVPAGRR